MQIDYTQLVSAAVSGGFVSWAATWLNEKSKARAYTMGAVDQAVKVALDSVTAEVARLNHEVARLRQSERECQLRNAELETKIDALEEEMEKLRARSA